MTWPTVALGDATKIVSGATPRTDEKQFWDGDVFWTTPKDISDLETPYLERPPRSITLAGLKSCAASVLPPNSVLLSSRAPIGLVAINRLPVATNQGFKSLIPDDSRLDPKFLYHWLRSKTAYLQSLGNGATFKEISKAIVERIEIPLPPLPEQRRIAAVLDKADTLRRKRKRAIELLGSLTQSIFLEMFGQGSVALARSQIVSVGEAGRVQLGRQRSPKYQTGKFARPYVRVANVQEDRIDTSDVLSMDFDGKDFADYALRDGDILLNEGQSSELVGRPAMWQSEVEGCCFQNTLIRFQADRSQVLPEFALGLFLHYFRSGEFSKVSSKTSNVAHLGAARFARMDFPLAPLDDQERYASIIRRVRETLSTKMAEQTTAACLFASLQHRAFSGQL